MPKARRPVPSLTAAPPSPAPPSPDPPSPAAQATAPCAGPSPAPAAPDALERLLRRSRLATLAPARPQEVLRVAGLPVLVAAMVTGQAAPSAVTHVVRRGDTVSGIAQQYGTDTATITRGNRLADPDRLRVGQRLAVPDRPGRAARTGGGGGGGGYRPAAVTYTVRAGDTVSDIARRTGLRVAAVLRANGLDAAAVVRPGQRLVLPGLRLPDAVRAPGRPRPVVHVVRPGDTVGGIARRYGLAQDDVLRANRLTATTTVRPGRKIVLPGARPRAAARPARAATHAHVVRRGDTLSAVAQAARVSLADVFALNHLTPSSVLRPGQRLLLPGAGPRPAIVDGGPTRDAVRQAAAGNRAALARRPAPGRRQVQAMVVAAARRLGVDPALAQAVAHQESGFQQKVVSPANAIGAMQVVPSSGRWASRLVGRPLDLFDARDNVVAGVAILAVLTRDHPEPTAIAAYYQGLGSVHRHGMYSDTRRYVADVQTLRARFREAPQGRP